MRATPASWKVSYLTLVRIQENLFPTLRKSEEEEMLKKKERASVLENSECQGLKGEGDRAGKALDDDMSRAQ